MNRWKLPVAVLAAFSLLSLGAAAQSTQDNKPTSSDPAKPTAPVAADANQAAPAAQDTSAAADTDKQQTPAEKKRLKRPPRMPPRRRPGRTNPKTTIKSARIRMRLATAASATA
jgi:hypothetical protein